jgi:hypothetical protein
VRFDVDDVREKVLALERKVFGDEVELVVSVLGARDEE